MTDPVTNTLRRVIFYPPHCDDDALFMGQIAAHHALVGRTNMFIPGSLGNTSAILKTLNEEEPNGRWGGYHHAAREGYEIPISPERFGELRDNELRGAAPLMGALPENVIFDPDRTSSISVDQAKALFIKYDAMFPGAGHYTMHWQDADPTHRNMGEALRQLRVADPLHWADVRWVVRPGQVVGSPFRNATMTAIPDAYAYVIPEQYKTDVKAMVSQASDAYSSWVPPDRLMIARQSVDSLFDEALSPNATNYLVKPVGW